MNTKAIIPLAAGLVIGGIALKMGSDALKRAQGANQPATLVEVFCAKHDIPRGELITEPMVSSFSMPPENVPEWAFTDKAMVVGRVTAVTTYAGEPFHSAAVLEDGALPGMHVPVGYRAVSIRIDENSGVNYHLEPGARVDIISISQTRTNGGRELIARTILENIEVGAVGQRISAERVSNESGEDAQPKRSGPVRAVWLFVTPAGAQELSRAEQAGQVKVVLRSGTDRAIVRPPAAGVEEKTADASELGGFFARMFQRPTPEPQPTPPPAVTPEPEPEPEPEFAVMMRVFNGDQGKVLAWKRSDSTEPPVELTVEEWRAMMAPAPKAVSPTANPTPTAIPFNPQLPTGDGVAGAGKPNTADSEIHDDEPEELE